MLRVRADVELIARWPVSLVSSYSQTRNIDLSIQETNMSFVTVTRIILLSLLHFCFAEQQTNICGFKSYVDFHGHGFDYTMYEPYQIENCQDCREVLCKQTDLTSASSRADNVCYWNDYRDICLPNRGWIICSSF